MLIPFFLSVIKNLEILEDNLKNMDKPNASTHYAPLSYIFFFTLDTTGNDNCLILMIMHFIILPYNKYML